MRCFKCNVKYVMVPSQKSKSKSWIKGRIRYVSGLSYSVSGMNGHFKSHSWNKNTGFINQGDVRF